jgi:phospholipid/cholesterol/gamma-HCH transport system ATP-binding protein
MSEILIRVKNVGKKFDAEWIFRNVSFDLNRGGSFAMVGPSGAGKSVLLKLLAGLIVHDEGEINIASDNIGMLFQKNALFDSFTVEENLLFPLYERQGMKGKKALERAHSFLDAVGLRDSAKLFPDEISGGMQKRLGIARALIVEPEVILYDEPTAGLDPVTSRVIADLINQLRAEQGTTLVTVTNDMQRAYQIGDKILVLANGALLDGGTPDEIQETQDPLIRQFIYGLQEGPLTVTQESSK